jgi:hypothetical protein
MCHVDADGFLNHSYIIWWMYSAPHTLSIFMAQNKASKGSSSIE